MASLLAVSERHLQRIFKKHLRCTPSRWLRLLQCRLAKDRIAQGYSSKAAALELKFATESHFCREFKKAYGVSPQSFAPHHLQVVSLEKWQPSVNERGLSTTSKGPTHSFVNQLVHAT